LDEEVLLELEGRRHVVKRVEIRLVPDRLDRPKPTSILLFAGDAITERPLADRLLKR
jgi:hypothetical protein